MLDKLFCFVQLLFFSIVLYLWSSSIFPQEIDWAVVLNNWVFSSQEGDSHKPFISFSRSLFYNWSYIDIDTWPSMTPKLLNITNRVTEIVSESPILSKTVYLLSDALTLWNFLVPSKKPLFFLASLWSRRDIHMYEIEYLWDNWFLKTYVELVI